jgi:hypothetical protein
VEKEEILQRTKNLPAIVMGNIAKDHQIWEGNEGGAHFKITKEIPSSLIGKVPTVYALSVSGNESGKIHLISDFENAFGKPIIRSADPQLPDIEFLLWKAEEIDKKRTR